MSAFNSYTIRNCWRVEQLHNVTKTRAGEVLVEWDGEDIALPNRGGWSESWWVFCDPDDRDVLFVASYHRSLQYVGLSEFARPESDTPFTPWTYVEERSYFAQEERVCELIGSTDLQPCTIVRRLFEFAHDRY
jgi:hypothetical protein